MSEVTSFVGFGAAGVVFSVSDPFLSAALLTPPVAVGWQRLSGDPIGEFALTLTNVVVGSAIRVETQAGALVEFRVADSTTEVFDLLAYTAGNALNDLRIKVRKGTSGTYYKPYETLTTAFVGAQSIYIAQIPD